jgi:transketolase
VPRLAVEAGVSAGWWKYVGLDGAVIGLDRFGDSAPAPALFAEFGFTVANVTDTAARLAGK